MELVTVVNVLVVNTGSSSLKMRLLGPADEVLASKDVERWDGTGHVAEFVDPLESVDVVGHRVVHGGSAFTGPVVIDAGVRDRIAALTELAPLHQPRALAGIDAVRKVLPDVPAVACFDTAFHAGMSDAAATYAIPAEWRRRWDLRRYGFHGLSHAYAARRACELADRPPGSMRVVSCHLGAGCSLCAVVGGRSVDTTMGFTPLEGLVMVTRSGTVDPGLLMWLLQRAGLGVDELADALVHRSGLAALAELPGNTGDLRDVHRAASSGSATAALALRVFVHRLRAAVAAMTAATQGLDALVFTGGIGEHDAWVRAETVAGLGYLGLALDPERNNGLRELDCEPDTDIGARDSAVRIFVVTAREDIEIATQSRAVIGVDDPES